MSARERGVRSGVVSWVASGLCVLGAVLVLVPLGGSPASGAQASTAMTKSGTGRFADLQVTVSQTEHLINQVVDVTWKGGKQTLPQTGSFNVNYLQIMQCWGDDPSGPKRENCQFGGFPSDTRGGTWANSRQVTYGPSLVDPAEPLKPSANGSPAVVPFTSVSGVSTVDSPNEFFDSYTTNEIDFGRTRADGTGQEFFEMQTTREAPGMGCGQRLDGGKVRDCWLVVVPRDALDVDGSSKGIRVESSPLAQSNWDHRIVFPMQFDPVGLACPVGAAERRLVGQEQVSDAITRWQPVLCQKTGSIFGFSQINDDVARQQTQADDPWLSFVSNPVDPSTVPEDRPLSYAPVAISGFGIAFNIDKVPGFRPPPDVLAQAGQRLASMRLNPRLVAKLLTQSYRAATFDDSTFPDNPARLTDDPEFRRLNPGLDGLDFYGLGQLTVPTGQADAYRELWQWVSQDPSARSFLTGEPDPFGMVVNPAYQRMSLDRSDFPKSDLVCRTFGGAQPDLCPLDAFAYAADVLDAARAAARGSTLSRSTYNPLAAGGYRLDPPQSSGQRSVMTVVDTSAAERFHLPMARLQNAAGEYVAPTEESMSAAVAAMKPSSVDPRVLQAVKDVEDPKAYPLTHLTYAVTTPSKLTDEEAVAYSRFLRYVAGPGQVPGIEPGRLPGGYVPLPAALKTQALKAADQIADGPSASPTPTGGASTPAGDGDTGGTTTGDGLIGGTIPDTGTAPVDAGLPGASTAPVDAAAGGAAPSAGASTSAAPNQSALTPAAAATTPSSPAGSSRYVVALLLLLTAAVLIARQLTLTSPRRGP